MQNTPNYGLKKPAQSDFYNVDDFNANADIIDAEFKNLEDNKLNKTGDASNVTNVFTQATTRANLTTGEKLSVSLGKLMKWFADLKPVAWSGNASDLTEDASNRLVTDTEKNTWNAKASTAVVTTTANGLMISTDKSKLDGISAGANNYVHPATHPPIIIAQDASNRFVTDAEKSTWNGKLDAASYTAADILAKTKTVDGSGSGLDADFLDGLHGASYVRADGSIMLTGDLNVGGNNIVNIADGVNPTDAVNKRQLDAVASSGGYEVHESVLTTSSWYKIADGIGNSFDGDFRVEFYNIATGEVGSKCEFYASHCSDVNDVSIKSSQLDNSGVVYSFVNGWYIDDTGLYVNIYSPNAGTEGVRITIYKQSNIIYNFVITTTSFVPIVGLNSDNSAMFRRIQVGYIYSDSLNSDTVSIRDPRSLVGGTIKSEANDSLLIEGVSGLDLIAGDYVGLGTTSWPYNIHVSEDDLFLYGQNIAAFRTANYGQSINLYSDGNIVCDTEAGLSMRPEVNNNTYLGTSSYQWKKLYLYDTVIGMADTRNAELITDIPGAVLDAWQEVKYQQFKRTDGTEWHFGVFAQHICEVFNARSLNSIDYGLVQYDEWEERRWIERDPITKEDVEKVEPAGSSYMVSHDECQYLELALQRRTIERLQAQIEELQALTAQLK